MKTLGRLGSCCDLSPSPFRLKRRLGLLVTVVFVVILSNSLVNNKLALLRDAVLEHVLAYTQRLQATEKQKQNKADERCARTRSKQRRGKQAGQRQQSSKTLQSESEQRIRWTNLIVGEAA